MKFAVIADVHSNIYALNAALEDIKQRGIERIYCAGDLVGYAPFPNEVIHTIKKANIPTVMGNYDEATAYFKPTCGCDYPNEKAAEIGNQSIAWTKKHTSEESKEFLKTLPSKIEFTEKGKKVLIVHGSPRQINEYLYETRPQEELEEIMSQADADILICGHTHLPYHKVINEKHLINAGSVGKPKHGDPMGTYVIVDIDQDVQVEIIKFPYDYEKTAQAIEASELPNELAALLRTGGR
jgi:putative phosphoesterase